MAFNKEARDRLQKFVKNARNTLEEDFCRQLKGTFGMNPETGRLSDLNTLHHLNTTDFETASDLREIYDHYHGQDPQAGTDVVLRRILREQTQTFLHRLCALRMAEARGVFLESLAKGLVSQGFQSYKMVVGASLGEDFDAYTKYLKSLFDEEAQDLPQIFDRTEPFGLLFPTQNAFTSLLGLINAGDLEPFWAEDETIGWIFQYFNSAADFATMRGQQNKNPKNAYEMAVRNQFFTPRYVVEFLLDNTLGRLWVEETKGHTTLLTQCRCLLWDGKPSATESNQWRDPRTIKILDPACGSMHFGLYAFDLLETIYEETWDWVHAAPGRTTVDLQGNATSFSSDWPNREDFLVAVPSLIVQNNIYGVDIDVRATQIASLALWLRAQKAWHRLGLPGRHRPAVGEGHVVAAVAPPPENDIQSSLAHSAHGDAAKGLKALSLQLLSRVPETGILLELEKDLEEVIGAADPAHSFEQNPLSGFDQDWQYQPTLELDLSRSVAYQKSNWEKKYEAIAEVLKNYASGVGHTFREQLYAKDAVTVLRLIDLCQKKFDAIVMNPPFGAPADGSRETLAKIYPSTKKEIIGMFILRTLAMLQPKGYVGAISSRTIFFQSSSEKWREKVLFTAASMPVFADLGLGVMDNALVESAAYVLGKRQTTPTPSTFIRLTKEVNKGMVLNGVCNVLRSGEAPSNVFFKMIDEFANLPGKVFAYNAPEYVVKAYAGEKVASFLEVKVGTQTSDNNRYVRLYYEIEKANKYWPHLAKGGEASPFYSDIPTVINWENEGAEIKEDICIKYPYLKGNYSFVVKNIDAYFRPGLTWTLRANSFVTRIYPELGIFDHGGSCCFLRGDQPLELLSASAILNSRAFQNLISVQLQWQEGSSRYECGMIATTPYPSGIPDNKKEALALLAQQNFNARRHLDSANEESHAFILPEVIQAGNRDINREAELKVIADSQMAMDSIVDELYGLVSDPIEKQEKSRRLASPSEDEKTNRLLMWAVGVAFGRFDIRLATGERDIPEQSAPFDLYPERSIGRLPKGDTLFIPNQGIFVMDPSHKLDLTRAVRNVLDEVGLGEDLDVDKWLKKDFFPFHLKIYSGAQRVAPIYWPIGTTSGNYVLWLYYTDFNNQTLYAALNDFIDPKLQASQREYDDLKVKETDLDSKGKRHLRELLDFIGELKVFRDQVEELAGSFEMHFNDGVAINASRMRHLIQSNEWRKKLDKVAKEIDEGKLDWSETAADLYPGRVKEVCRKNKSIALAHKDRFPLEPLA